MVECTAIEMLYPSDRIGVRIPLSATLCNATLKASTVDILF
ncbi:hypothetical protein [Oricola cellulosilytica]|nr:hypothetical protein [Oricola cellulosilytica]